MKYPVIDQKGEKIKEIELNETIFGAKINPQQIALACRVYLYNKRLGTCKTKARGEVRGGGKKPWRQKHTGRARQGSIRSPLWVGGGHAKAKIPRDFSLKISKEIKRQALFGALSDKRENKELVLLDKFELKEISAKKAFQTLQKITSDLKTLIVIPEKNTVIEKSIKNLSKTNTIEARLLNPYAILNCQKLVFLLESLPVIEKTFLKEKEEKND